MAKLITPETLAKQFGIGPERVRQVLRARIKRGHKRYQRWEAPPGSPLHHRMVKAIEKR